MKKGQITVFIIIAILLVAAIIGFFFLKRNIVEKPAVSDFSAVEIYFQDCIKQKAERGKEMLGERGGYIYMPEFEPGSEFAPFSSELDFFGTAVPYWYYVSGNNIVKEAVPSRSDMEEQLGRYVRESLSECDFSGFASKGIFVDMGNATVKANIENSYIDLDVKASLDLQKENQTEIYRSRKVKIESNLGKFYNQAVKIYDHEQSSLFLERYSLDVLRLYAPVDGVEITCSPKVWMPEKVVSDLKDALEVNTFAIKLQGDYYDNKETEKYFIEELKVDSATNFIYNQEWPHRIEIWPSEGAMIAEPVGNQEGMGVLGFCYVPYHFVYDVMFPVLVQVYDDRETFQFPVSVIIRQNQPREPLEGTAVSEEEIQICETKNSEVTVKTYGKNLMPVEADISFKCFQTSCEIGRSEISDGEAVLEDRFPPCVNGQITAKAEGYADKKETFSTNKGGELDIILEKLYDLDVSLKVDGKESSDSALIYFKEENYSASVVWPEQKQIKLKQGDYQVSVYVYGNSSLIFPATTQQKCVKVASSGLLGMFGQTKEKCFDIQMPQQVLTSVLKGGGKTNDYLTEDRLESGKMEISVPSLTNPTSFEQLQKNYASFESNTVEVITDG